MPNRRRKKTYNKASPAIKARTTRRNLAFEGSLYRLLCSANALSSKSHSHIAVASSDLATSRIKDTFADRLGMRSWMRRIKRITAARRPLTVYVL
jgi:hypothetical protein